MADLDRLNQDFCQWIAEASAGELVVLLEALLDEVKWRLGDVDPARREQLPDAPFVDPLTL